MNIFRPTDHPSAISCQSDFQGNNDWVWVLSVEFCFLSWDHLYTLPQAFNSHITVMKLFLKFSEAFLSEMSCVIKLLCKNHEYAVKPQSKVPIPRSQRIPVKYKRTEETKSKFQIFYTKLSKLDSIIPARLGVKGLVNDNDMMTQVSLSYKII